MILSDLRNYEVSIWTLQDEFISVLKYATLENKGQIQQPQLKIVDDGIQEFTFKIPMYILEDEKMKQNPIWYNTTNGNIISNTRKIKVIINKKDAIRVVSQQQQTQEQEIFQFIIIKVTQTHQDEVLTCEVSCQGLAFHELGKIGYKFSLSQEQFLNEYNEWAKNSGSREDQPHATIQYWNDKIFNHLKYWTYQVNMNWDGYLLGKNDQYQFIYRDEHKVYQDTYASSWDRTTGAPIKIEMAKQKQRQIDSSESNVYNLTQTIAQTFGVYCKYIYEHDNNYHIIGRKVIYYNNFLNEENGTLDITYPYSTSSVSRQMDSTDLITKMYVKPVTSDSTRDGFINILTTSANRSGEDYLLNFDYMKDIGSINQEQYQQIFNFQRKIAKINEILQTTGQQILKLQECRLNVEANMAIYEKSKKLSEQRYTEANALINSITKDTGVVQVTGERPAYGVLLLDNKTNNYYLNVSQTGIVPETFHIYTSYSSTATNKEKVSNQIFGTFEFNEFNDLVKVVNIQGQSLQRSVYLTYNYQPLEYAKRVKKIWERKMNTDKAEYEKVSQQLEVIDASLEMKNEIYRQKLLEKQKLIQSFQTMMGPALRQGYWMPDQYNDYGDKMEAKFQNGFSIGTVITEIINGQTINVKDPYGNNCYTYEGTDENGYATPIWDEIPFDGEQLPYYQQGINRDKVYYPCIKLTLAQLEYIQQHQNVSLIFYDLKNNQNQKNFRSFVIGSECQLGLLKDSSENIFPVLIITGAKDMTKEQIKNMQSGGSNEIIFSQSNSFEKVTTHAVSQSTVKINDQLSKKVKKQLITTTNIDNQIISEKTIIKRYDIITKQIQPQQPSQPPEPDVQTTTIMKNVNIGKNTTSWKNINSNVSYDGSQNSLSFEFVVVPGDWAYGELQILIGRTQIYNNRYHFVQGVNRIDCKNTKNINGQILFKIKFDEGHYCLLISAINMIITKDTSTKIIQPKIQTVTEEVLTQLVIQEKNLFHKNPFQFVFNDEYDENGVVTRKAYFNNINNDNEDNDSQTITEIDYGEEINTNQFIFRQSFKQNDNYDIIEIYNIDKVNKICSFVSRKIEVHSSGEEKYSETINNNTGVIQIINTLDPLTITHIIKTPTEVEQGSTSQIYNITTYKSETLDESVLSTGARLGQFTYEDGEVKIDSSYEIIAPVYIKTTTIDWNNYTVETTYVTSDSSDWMSVPERDQPESVWPYTFVYPRIQINSLKLKQNDIHLTFLYSDETLSKYKDYSLLSRNDKYYLSLKINKLLESGKYIVSQEEQQNQVQEENSDTRITISEGNLTNIPILKLYYCLSNADTAIYLDAVQVLKENAYPKVSYQIKVNMINPDFIRTIYNKMGYIAHINDYELKFDDVLGYISQITMHLDKPWEDQIVIKNYKSGFQNLFSNIVAATQAMKKSTYTIGLAAGAFDSNGNLSLNAIEQALTERGLIFNFNNGKLTINQQDGILGTSQSGIINFRCNGIFTSSKKDENDEWVWNTAITPNGINANLITSGQLDTNLIKIFAGDKLRFQLNGDGLFGYRSFVENFGMTETQRVANILQLWNQMSSEEQNIYGDEDGYDNFYNLLNNPNNSDKLQYITFNENGLFLRAEKGAAVCINNNYSFLSNPVTRVQVSWDGLKLRNWNNDEVFWADPDTGNLYITGTIFADAFQILSTRADLNDENSVPMSLNEYTEFKFEDHVKVSQNLTYIFNAAADIIKRAWSSLSSLNGTIVENANVLNDFLVKAKQLPYEPIQLVIGNGQGTTVSGLVLHPTQGIWMGSTNKITFYSGNAKKLSRDEDTGEYVDTLTGATMTMDNNRILLGVSRIMSVNSGSGAVQITPDKIILAVGNTMGSFTENNEGQSIYTSNLDYNALKTTLSGVVITKDSIGLATSATINGQLQRNLILMDENGIVIGNATAVNTNINSSPIDNNYHGQYEIYSSAVEYHKDDVIKFENKYYACLVNSIQNVSPNDDTNHTVWKELKLKEGSFVKINNQGIIIGSDSNMYVNTNNLGIDSSQTMGSYFRLGSKLSPDLIYTSTNGLIINGQVTATSFILSGTTITTVDNGQTSTFDLEDINGTIDDLSSDLFPITTYGISSGEWNDTDYGLILGNSSSDPMLIASNSGIQIANLSGTGSAIVLDSNGIVLNASSLNFTTTSGDSIVTTITLNSGGINMAALGEVRIQGNEGFIQFGTEDSSGEDINFKVDKDGNVYCKKLICQDIRTDNLSYVKKQDSATGNTSGQYTLYYFGNVDKKYGYSGHTRTAVFKLLNGSNLQTGTYQIILDWWLISSDNPLGRYTISATTNLDSTRTLFSLVGNDNVYSRAKDIKITGGSNSGIALNGNMGSSPSTFTFYIYNTTDSITFNIYMNYDGGNSGLYGTMWNMSRTDQKQNTIILNKIS